ncbi:hypothetical protein Btru_022933 [Bulinus truncatus]|nr:hypothetical protein Btru_022933 [Bulinus truncatus]
MCSADHITNVPGGFTVAVLDQIHKISVLCLHSGLNIKLLSSLHFGLRHSMFARNKTEGEFSVQKGGQYRFFWSGRKTERRSNGVAVVIKTAFDDFEILAKSERIMHCRLKTFGGIINIINVYSPQENEKKKLKKSFTVIWTISYPTSHSQNMSSF